MTTTLGVLIAAASLTGATAANAAPSGARAGSPAPADPLGGHDLRLLAEAKAAGRTAVTLIVATDRGEAKAVADRLTALGGSVSRRFDRTGYVLASVPTASVVAAAGLPGIAAVDLDEQIALPDPGLQTRSATPDAAADAVPAPGPDTPAVNPYLPTHEIGVVDFVRRHPTYDGRGVTIGIMDSGVDLDNPALQTTSTGERKIVNWVTATDPVLDGLLAGDGTWRDMVTRGVGPRFTALGATWTAPAGDWRISDFREDFTGNAADYAGDVNRDGDDTDVFGVLYDPVSHDIRVDTDQDRDFTNNPVLRPYREKYDVGHFGVDNPATEVRERVPFVVEYREDVDLSALGGDNKGKKTDFVNIGIVDSSHGSHVAGISAGNNMFDNANFDGAAPGAKIVSSRACLWGSGCSASALTTGMTDLVENQHVDVINMSISGLGPMNSGGSARALLYNRLINQYGVQLFLAVGNAGPGVNTVGDPSVAVDAVGVGSTVSRATWRANYGSVVRRDYTIQPFSSRGPREDGGLKPNIVAPGSAISTVPLWRPGSPVPEAGYPLPAGYAMMQGTSMASPLAAGAAALLLSAARSNDLGVNPAALRRAIYSAADWIPGAPAHAQGNGLFDVSGAWNLLKRTVDTRSFTVDAPVCTPLSDTLPTPHRGTGIYNRCPARAGGHRAGQSKSYQLKLTRTSGPARGITHRLSWLGNDGTFRSAGNVVLGLNRTASISVTAKPPAGVQSAILRVDDPATPTVDFEVLNTVIAANDLAAPDFSFAGSGSVDRNQTTSFFVNVPAGASALQVNLAGIAAGSQTRFVSIDPSGVPVDETATNRCYPNYPDPKGCNPVERDYQRPMAGIWEFEVEARRTSPALNNPFQISVRAQGATLTPAVLTLPSLTLGQPTPVSWTLRNDFGPVQVTNTAGDLRSAASTRSSIGQGRTQTFEVVVPAGTSRLEAAIGKASDPGADLDLEILLNGRLVKESVGRTAEELISLTDPAAGTYTMRVQGYAVPAGTTGYDYRDLFISTALGSVTVSPGTASVAAGASITLTGSVTARAPVPAGRRLFGELTVHTDQEARIGGGRIDIDAVH